MTLYMYVCRLNGLKSGDNRSRYMYTITSVLSAVVWPQVCCHCTRLLDMYMYQFCLHVQLDLFR